MPIFQSRLKDTIVKSASGICIVTENKRYLDAISGMFNMPFGYSCNPIVNTICETLRRVPFHPKEHFYTEDYLNVSECLLKKTSMDNGGVLFLSGGSEAVEAAITMAIQYHLKTANAAKRKIIARAHSYHGATLGAKSVTGRNNFTDILTNAYDTIRIAPPFLVHGDNGKEKPDGVDDIENRIVREGPDNIAAFIFEPVNHLKGMHQASLEYLQGVRMLCSKYNILMIVDEIVSGMGRTGPFLNTHKFGVTPDIAILGKGLSGGYTPVSAIVANSQIANTFAGNDEWRYFSYSHTYAANPVGISATKAALSLLQSIGHTNEFSVLQKSFESKVAELRSLGNVIRAESSGLLAGITLDFELGFESGKCVEKLCFKSGVIVRGEENWIALVPSYTTSSSELNEIFRVLRKAIQTVSLKRSGTHV